ncbi:MAG: thiamine-phosphate kinase [Burkholderiaceae bacterium]
MGEFELIQRYFARRAPSRPEVVLGIGDDCALLAGIASLEWAVTTDLLVEGIHFLPDVDPRALGHKSLAVNLSDLAACGATPVCFFLSIALPRAEPAWLEAFADGLFRLADPFGCQLAGGDTTRSTAGVTINITALGRVAAGATLRRSGARAGDDVWVSGSLGSAALGLALRRGELRTEPSEEAVAIERLERPTPRVELGQRLVGLATSAIDVSDGLVGDLGHVLAASAVGADIHWEDVPCGVGLAGLNESTRRRFALAGGDDYELLFTAPAGRRSAIEAAGAAAGVPVTRIGAISAAPGLRVLDRHGEAMDSGGPAFDHFRP